MFLLPAGPNYLGDVIALCIVLSVQGVCAWILWCNPRFSSAFRRALPWILAASGSIVTLGFLLRFHRVNRFFPAWSTGWGRGAILTWAVLSVLLAAAWAISRSFRSSDDHSPARRAFLRIAQGAILGSPAIATGYGVFIARFRITLREQKIFIPNLPADLEGLRLAQLTDIHLGPFLSEKELAHAVDLANETRPHLMLVTGDLITAPEDPLDQCLAQLARLKADAGVFGCNGNHEIYAGVESYVEQAGARQGLHIFRSRAEQLRFGDAVVNLAGVDYQMSRKPYLRGAQRMVEPGAVNILLSHNPDVFPVAAAQGYQLTVSGHTHGGQVRVEILNQDLNVARFFTPYVDGLYRRAGADGRDASIFVSRGIGTIAVPARFGAPPEVALLILSAQDKAES